MGDQRRPVIYADRTDAGRRIAAELTVLLGPECVVLGLPRGGVEVAAAIAAHLRLQLDVLVVRKISVPWNPELAVGAVTSDGLRYLNEPLIRALFLTEADLEATSQRELQTARGQDALLRGSRQVVSLHGRQVLVVDDGLATGATMIAALHSLAARNPAQVIATAPVGSDEACRSVSALCDALVCPWRPSDFHSVGSYYQDFAPVSEARVQKLLAESGR